MAAIAAYLLFRLRPRVRIAVVIGAGLAYAWVDFVNKLLANDISKGDWVLAVVWLVLTVAFGALAFLEETTALQVRPAVTVAPVNDLKFVGIGGASRTSSDAPPDRGFHPARALGIKMLRHLPEDGLEHRAADGRSHELL